MPSNLSAEDLLAEHLAGCGRCADAVTADE